MTATVFVTGATGFIAQHLVKQLLDKNYKVIGSVRSQEKGEAISKNFSNANFSYVIVESLTKEGAYDVALKNHPEVEIFLHTASPVTAALEDVENNILLPAIDGTKIALKAIEEHGKNVRKVVVTSSIAAVLSLKGNTGTVTDKNWNDITWEESTQSGIAAYFGSKTFAEKAAWEFVDKNKPSWTLSTVVPVYVFGPQAFDSSTKGTLNGSSEILLSLLRLKPEDPIPQVAGYFADVRDVARAHIAAFESVGAVGQRLIVSDTFYTFHDILNVITKRFPQLHVVKSSSEKTEAPYLIDTVASRKIIGDQFIDFETSVYDTVKQFIENQ